MLTTVYFVDVLSKMDFKETYNPIKGVRTDFKRLLEKFTEKGSVRFEHFTEVWRSMKFSFIYAGRNTENECREFYEEVLPIALSFYLPPYNFQLRVGGLYMLYGVYMTQPCVPKVLIRVTYEQWVQIQEFQQNIHEQKHLDVEYIFQKLFHLNAFHFVATPREVYIKSKDREDEEKEKEVVLANQLNNVASSVSSVFTPQIMQQLQAIHTQYQQLKLGIAGPNAVRPDRSLDVAEDNIMINIADNLEFHKQKLEKIKSGSLKPPRRQRLPNPEDDDDEDDDFNPDSTSRRGKASQAQIKARAYTQKAKQSKGRRHRTTIIEEESSPEKDGKRRRGKGKAQKKSKALCEQEEESEMLQSTSMEESSGVMSPEEYLSMPTLDAEPAPEMKPTKSPVKVLTSIKSQTSTESRESKKSSGPKNTKSSAKKSDKSTKNDKTPKSKNPKITTKTPDKSIDVDKTPDKKSKTVKKESAKKKVKTTPSKKKLTVKLKVSPVKKSSPSVKGKRKVSLSKELQDEPKKKLKKLEDDHE